MRTLAFPAALLIVATMLLGPLLEWAPVVRARTPHEVLCGDHDCGCDGAAPVSSATCCCAGALREAPGAPPPPAEMDATEAARWRRAWGDTPACRPATLHGLPESRVATSPCGVDLAPEGLRIAARVLAPLPPPTWIPRPGIRRRRSVEARVSAVRRPPRLGKVPIQSV